MSSPEQTPRITGRRSVIKGAAWAAPTMVIATGAPALAASTPTDGPEPNAEANYYWDASADAWFAQLDPAESDLRFQFSTQISYRADPWANPPEGASLQVAIRFTQHVILESAGGGWEATPSTGEASTDFVFVATPAAYGNAFTGSFLGTASGAIRATAVMSVLNGGEATWAEEPGRGTGMLVE